MEATGDEPKAERVRGGAPRLLALRGWLGGAFAIGTFAVALALREAVDPVLPPGFPFLTFFPAVIVTTFVGGRGPGILCAVLSGLAAWYFFIPPFDSFAIDGQVALALVFYVAIVGVDIALIHVTQRVGERLRAERAVTAALYEQQRALFTELQHRVANNMQVVGTLLAVQKRKVDRDPGSGAAALAEAEERLAVFARIHRSLYDPSVADRPVGDTLRDLCADVIEASGRENVALVLEASELTLDLARLTTLCLLVVEIVTNALKHAFPEGRAGRIAVRLARAGGGRLLLTVSDDGCGWPDGFDPAASRRLGFRIVHNLATQLGGTLAYASECGAVVRLDFADA